MIIYVAVLSGQQMGQFIDTRDGKSYKTVTYDLQLPNEVMSDIDEYKTYESQSPSNYEIEITNEMPISMTWMAENLNFETVESKCFKDTDYGCEEYGRLYSWAASLKACPEGWHLATDNEWYILASQYGGVSSAGEHLKSEEINGTNKSLFNVRKPSIFWSSDEMNDEYAWDWKVNFRWTKLQRWKGGKDLFNLVRCVKDYN